MYEDFANFGFMHRAEQDAITERAGQTARWIQAFRNWRRKRRAGTQKQRIRRRRGAYTTAAGPRSVSEGVFGRVPRPGAGTRPAGTNRLSRPTGAPSTTISMQAGIAVGAFSDGRLVGIGLVVPRLRFDIAQFAFLHVKTFHATGIGRRLSDALEVIARDAGDAGIVVSATPSTNTVHFYMSRGYELMAQPLHELDELEPEDVHMKKAL